MPNSLGTIREFRTANFRVIVDAIEEESPDLSWDDTGETAANIDLGHLIVFCARARVIHDELGELSADYLGNCVYESLPAFMDHKLCGVETRKLRAAGSQAICGSYFADMVATVCAEARKRWQEISRLIGETKLRAVQS